MPRKIVTEELQESKPVPLTKDQFYKERVYEIMQNTKNRILQADRDAIISAINVLHRKELRLAWEAYAKEHSSK